MISTNSNNLGIIIFALSNTFILDSPYAEEQQLRMEEYFPMEEMSYMSLPKDISTNTSNFLDNLEDETFENIIIEFANELISKSQNLEPDFQKIIEKRFWDMI